MSKQVLTLGIVLSFATTACTGLGVQTGPTLAGQIVEEQGLGGLWGETERETPSQTVAIEYRDDRELADLWMQAELTSGPKSDSGEEAPRAAATFEKLTLTESVVNLDSDRSKVLRQ